MLVFYPDRARRILVFFFFNAPATTEIYTLSLHDALTICSTCVYAPRTLSGLIITRLMRGRIDRKSTRLNSSHQIISYAVFCLKKKTGNCSSEFETQSDP